MRPTNFMIAPVKNPNDPEAETFRKAFVLTDDLNQFPLLLPEEEFNEGDIDEFIKEAKKNKQALLDRVRVRDGDFGKFAVLTRAIPEEVI